MNSLETVSSSLSLSLASAIIAERERERKRAGDHHRLALRQVILLEVISEFDRSRMRSGEGENKSRREGGEDKVIACPVPRKFLT